VRLGSCSSESAVVSARGRLEGTGSSRIVAESPPRCSRPFLVPLPLASAPFPFVLPPFVATGESSVATGGDAAGRAGIGRSPFSVLTRSRDLMGLSSKVIASRLGIVSGLIMRYIKRRDITHAS